MIQKKYPASWEKKKPWEFIPRRDLFPDAEVPLSTEQAKPIKQTVYQPGVPPEKKYNTPVHRMQNKAASRMPQQRQKAAQKPEKSSPLPLNRPMTPVNFKRRATPEFLLLLFGSWLFLEFMGSKKKEAKLLNELRKPQVIEMLKAIGPYLEDNQQDAIYTAAGVMEAMHMVRDVMNHTYQNLQRTTIMNVPSNPRARKVEAIKAIKPYIASDNRRQLDQALDFYEGADRVRQNLMTFQNNQVLREGRKTSPLELASDILNVIRPVLSREQKEQTEKAQQIIKMIEVMGAVNKGSQKGKKQYALKSAEGTSKENQAAKENSTGSSAEIEKIMDSFAPMLNEEQKESMNMIMKMAQLLSQPKQDDALDSDGD